MERGDRPEDLRVTVLFLRALRGWEQKDLADAAGLAPSTISRYESGELAPSEEALEEIALTVGLPKPMLIRVRSLVRAAQAALESTFAPDDDLLWVHARATEVSLEVADRMYAAVVVLLTGFLVREPAPAPLRAPHAEDREEAVEAWDRLKPLPPSLRRTAVENFAEFQTWALSERICADSLEVEDGDEALELAELALRIAERAGLEELWSEPLQGYAWAHVGNAKRQKGDQAGAEEAFKVFRKLWKKGKPRDRGILDEISVCDVWMTKKS